MTIQSWVANRLRKEKLEVRLVKSHGLQVARPGRATEVLASVPEPGEQAFELSDFDKTLAEYSGCEAIIVIKRPVGAGVMEAAASRHVLVGPLGHFQRAIEGDEPVAEFRHPDDVYLWSRLIRHRNVASATRIGLNAWRIERTAPLVTLTIVRHDRYEFPIDELNELLAAHPGLELDAIVVTNPNASGLSKRVVEASHDLGIPIYLLDEFLKRLALP